MAVEDIKQKMTVVREGRCEMRHKMFWRMTLCFARYPKQVIKKKCFTCGFKADVARNICFTLFPGTSDPDRTASGKHGFRLNPICADSSMRNAWFLKRSVRNTDPDWAPFGSGARAQGLSKAYRVEWSYKWLKKLIMCPTNTSSL